MEYKKITLDESEVKFESSGAFSGYASVFGGVDSYGDTILPGAYKSTLKTFGMPKMFFNHRSHDLPLGKWTAKEDAKGLFVEGEFTPGNFMAEQVHAGAKHGTIDGLSIGYALKKGDFQESEKGRTIQKITRLAEVSWVTFPADNAARVDLSSVKQEDIEELESVRDLERFLRDVGGLSKAASTTFVSRAKLIFGAGGSGANDQQSKELEALFQRMQTINQLLKAK